ncbi:MAG: hypothetical protein ACT4PS_10730 [Betaproteobacteria bacterium]
MYFEPIALSGERYCIAMVGRTTEGEAIARSTVAPRVARCVIGHLGANLVGFSRLVVKDFKIAMHAGMPLEKWRPPFDRMALSETREFDGNDAEQMLRAASVNFALLAHEPETERTDEEISSPRADDERKFIGSVQALVRKTRPGLVRNFGQTFSLAGGTVKNRVDYLSASYGACYSTINPSTPKSNLLLRAQAALWKLARARDATGFAQPKTLEVVLWTPQSDLPIFSRQQYDIVDETVEELTTEAAKEALGVVSVHSPNNAGERLLRLETV